MSRFHGWDMALNHSGFVELNEAGVMTWWSYVIDKPTLVRKGGTHLKLPKQQTKDPGQHNLRRLAWWHEHISSIVAARKPTHTGIEDYALMTQSGAHLKGELGGIARLYATRNGGRLRIHDPMSIKMYIAHSGAAKPETVAAAVEERWPVVLKAWEGHCELARLDLAVAYGVAQMVLAEHKLRTGQLTMADFTEHEIRVWNRATKAYPTSLLSRDWISR